MNRWLTHAEAATQNPFELAAYWGDPQRWPGRGERDAAVELHELSTMAALADWLTRWLPIHVHAALLGGASVPQVAAALGVSPGQVRGIWAPWADGQVELWQTSNPARPLGVSPEQAGQVRGVLDAFDTVRVSDRGTV
jgi:hypothetical protein